MPIKKMNATEKDQVVVLHIVLLSALLSLRR